jgi:hypothetical protein
MPHRPPLKYLFYYSPSQKYLGLGSTNINHTQLTAYLVTASPKLTSTARFKCFLSLPSYPPTTCNCLSRRGNRILVGPKPRI